jgi:hypothetical protein
MQLNGLYSVISQKMLLFLRRGKNTKYGKLRHRKTGSVYSVFTPPTSAEVTNDGAISSLPHTSS